MASTAIFSRCFVTLQVNIPGEPITIGHFPLKLQTGLYQVWGAFSRFGIYIYDKKNTWNPQIISATFFFLSAKLTFDKLEAGWLYSGQGVGFACGHSGFKSHFDHRLHLSLVILESNPSRFVNSQLVCFLPVGVFNCVMHVCVNWLV